MKLLHINSSDIEGGAARAAFRLHRGLRDCSVDSKMMVGIKRSDDKNVLFAFSRWPLGASLVRKILDDIPLKLYKNKRDEIFSSAIVPDHLNRKISKLDPDLIHLHWVANGFLRIESLKKFNKPLIWTLHDSWAFTGGCHIPGDCTRYRNNCGLCPVLGSRKEKDLSRKIWQRKREAWKGLNLTIVTPSRWLAQCVKESSLLNSFKVEVIPNGLDTEKYKPIDKNVVREVFSLPKGKKLILFSAANCLTDHNKGFHLLASALQKLVKRGWGDNVEILVFGGSESSINSQLGFKTRCMGWLHDDISLAQLYSAADVMVIPSLQEAFCQTASESLACGTPVVAFDATGLLDIVEHKKNGYLARPFEIDDFAQGIQWVLEDEERAMKMSASAREKARREYDLSRQVRQYVTLYEDILMKAENK